MRRPDLLVPRDERGMATAEYAVATLGAACIGCVVFQLAANDPTWLTDLFQRVRDVVGGFGLPGWPRQGLM